MNRPSHSVLIYQDCSCPQGRVSNQFSGEAEVHQSIIQTSVSYKPFRFLHTVKYLNTDQYSILGSTTFLKDMTSKPLFYSILGLLLISNSRQNL